MTDFATYREPGFDPDGVAVTELPVRAAPGVYVLRGYVNPQGRESVGFFQYGKTKDYELGETKPRYVGAGTEPVLVEETVVGLSGVVHYRVVRDDV